MACATRRRGGECGQTLTVFALTASLLMAFLAIAVDLAYGYSQRRFVQNTADLAALAGTSMLARSIGVGTGDTDVATAVDQVKGRNLLNAAEQTAFTLSASYVDSSGNAIGAPGGVGGAPPANAVGVRVDTSRQFPTWFGHFLRVAAGSGGAGGGGGYTGGANEQQTVTITGNPTGGSFTLTFNGATTSSIAFNASSAQVQAALNALPTIGGVGGSVSVTGSAGGPYSVTFLGALGAQNVPTMSATSYFVSGGAASVAVTRDGSVPRLLMTTTGTGTAILKYVTGVSTDHPDFFPYIVWRGSFACKAALGENIIYMTNQYIANWVDTDCNGNQNTADPLWHGNSNNFRGYLHNASGVIRNGTRLDIDTAGGNAFGTQPIAGLQAHYDAGKPIILPVIGEAWGNGSNIQLNVIGFVLVKLTNRPCGNNQCTPFRGQIIQWVATNVETDGTPPTGTNAAARTVVLTQ